LGWSSLNEDLDIAISQMLCGTILLYKNEVQLNISSQHFIDNIKLLLVQKFLGGKAEEYNGGSALKLY